MKTDKIKMPKMTVEISTVGQKMATFPAPPSPARVLLLAATERIAEPVLAIVAMLSAEQIYV